MLTICYSPKGGQGCTTVAVALAWAIPDALLIDTAGDAHAVAGMATPSGPGICDLLAGHYAVSPELLDRLTDGEPGLSIVPAGVTPADRVAATRWEDLAAGAPADRTVIVDAATNPDVAAMPADRRIMVVQACYLALRRAAAHPVQPDQIVFVSDPTRALAARDVEAAVSAPVTATVPIDPAIARAIDAGLLTTRMPRILPADELLTANLAHQHAQDR